MPQKPRLTAALRLAAALMGIILAAWPFAANAAVDAVKLRQAVPFPSLSFSFGYSATRGMIVSNNPVDQSVQLAALKKPLTGGAEDAERWQRIGLFYNQVKDTAASRQAYTRAAALYHAQTQKRPADEALLVRSGVVLDALSEPVSAEAVLRQATRLAPQDADAWAALGQALMDQAFPALLAPEQQKAGVSVEQPAALNEQFKDYKPAPKQIKRARQLLEEARHCFDKAVLVQPNNPVGYVYRSGFHMYGQGILANIISAVAEQNVPLAAALQKYPASLAQNVFTSPSALADVQQAAQVAPNDLPTVASAALFQVLATAAQWNEAHGAGQEVVWDAVAPERRQAVEQDVSLLEHLAQSKDAEVASQAANAAGLIWMFANRNRDAERDLRLAVARDPHNQSAWEGLAGLVVTDKRYADGAALAAQRLQTLDDAHTRLFLAKIDDKLDQPAQAQAEVQSALKDEPNDLSANLAQATLLLRRSGDPAVLQQAKQQLDQCGLIYQKNQTTDNWKNYTVTVSVYDALVGSEVEARKGLALVLSTDKGNKEVAQVLAAMGPPEPAKLSRL